MTMANFMARMFVFFSAQQPASRATSASSAAPCLTLQQAYMAVVCFALFSLFAFCARFLLIYLRDFLAT